MAEGTVLVVEDSESMRLLCRVNLELEGYRVLEAPSLGRARELLSGEDVDVVLLDVHVGPESGYDLVDDIRQDGRRRIALITGTSQPGAVERGRVDAVIPKPFALDDLTSTVRRLKQA